MTIARRRFMGPMLTGCLVAASAPACSETESAVEPACGLYAPHPGPCTEQVDVSGDGVADQLFEYTYDGAGLLVREEEEHPDAGWLFVTTFEYDAHDNPVRVEWDEGGDGEVDRVYVETNEYDVSGNLVRVDSDGQGDGAQDRITLYEYDSLNRMVREANDDLADGDFDRVRLFHYGEVDRLVRMDIDLGDDGVIDHIWTYTYDRCGLRVRSQADTNVDGDIDQVEKHSYDEQGNMTHSEGPGGRVRDFSYGCWSGG